MQFLRCSVRLSVFMIVLFFMPAVSGAAICSYPGPDSSGQGLLVSDILITANEPVYHSDPVVISFTLTNGGMNGMTALPPPVTFDDRSGIFAVAVAPDGTVHQFGNVWQGKMMSAGESAQFRSTFTPDQAGTWVFYPSYCIKQGKGVTCGPDRWHACKVSVLVRPVAAPKIIRPVPTLTIVRTTAVTTLPTPGTPERDTTPPSVTVYYYPREVTVRSNVTFEITATDASPVTQISLYVDGNPVHECSPPIYSTQGNLWICTYTGGPYPAGTHTYSAEARDAAGNARRTVEGSITVAGLTFQLERTTLPQAGISIPCSISGRLWDFTYLSKTLQVRVSEGEYVGGGCSPQPPYFCFPTSFIIKPGGREIVMTPTRVWAGEEHYRNPGPMDYRVEVPCNATYRIAPVFQPYNDECEWMGRWSPSNSNIVTMDEPIKEGYDFTFSSVDMTAPGIDIREGPLHPPATNRWQGNWNISIAANDPNGIQRIQVTGNITIDPFTSDENGPLEVPTGRRDIPVTTLFMTSPAEISIPYFENAKDMTVHLRVKACDSYGNAVETTYLRTYPDTPGDLSIVSVEPVQTVYGAPLVFMKGTAFRAVINSDFDHAVETTFRLRLPADQWETSFLSRDSLPSDWQYPEIWGPIKIPAHTRNYEIMLPIIPEWQRDTPFYTNPAGLLDYTNSGPRRNVPRPVAGLVHFTVEMDPDNQLDETNEGNNRVDSLPYNVIKTKRWDFYFVPYRDNGMDNGAGCSPAPLFVQNGAKHQMEYLLGMFPIADTKIEYDIAPDEVVWETREGYPGYETREHFLKKIARMAADYRYDFGVAIGCGGGGGASGSSIHAVFIGDVYGRYSSLLSHEFNHVVADLGDVYSYRAAGWDVPYCEFVDRYERCPEEYRGKNACEYYCDNNVGRTFACHPDYVSNTQNSCTLWKLMGGSNCPEYINTSTNCEVWCMHGRCPADMTIGESMCEHWCGEEGGQKVYVAPDGRNVLPSTEGFWVNRWIPIDEESSNYIMDGCKAPNCTWAWMRAESLADCVRKGECGHRNPDGSIIWGDIGDSSNAHGIGRDGYINLLSSDSFKNEFDPAALVVSGTIRKNDTAVLDPFTRLSDSTLDIMPGTDGEYSFVLSDGNGNVLSKSGFDISFVMLDPHGGPVDEVPFLYRIEWKEGTNRIDLQGRLGKILASRAVSTNAPTVRVMSPNGGERWTNDTSYRITWEGSDSDGDLLTYSLAVSKDAGKTWLPVAIDITANEYRINTTGWEAGDGYLAKVRASDGVNTVEDISDRTFSIISAVRRSPTPAGNNAMDIAVASSALLAVSFMFRRVRGR
jgi:hypothetical protein